MKSNSTLQRIHRADLRMLLWFERLRLHLAFMSGVRLVSRSGDGYLQLLFPLLVCWFSQVLGSAFLLTYVYCFAVERSIFMLLKNTLRRLRPPAVLPHFYSSIITADKFSLPSGHTMAAFLLATIACVNLGTVAAVSYGWAILVGISRVILGVHFPSDIIVGAMLGILIGCLVPVWL